jgi:hypothetical protein
MSVVIKINNKQNINLVNSPNSPIIQAGGNVTSSSIETFKKEIKKEIAFSEEAIEEETTSKKQIKKIEDYLIENRYNIKDTSAEFHGCLYWIKDMNDTDKKLMATFAKQGKTVIRFLSDKDPRITLAKDGGSFVS